MLPSCACSKQTWHQNKIQNQVYCQVGFHIQGICLGMLLHNSKQTRCSVRTSSPDGQSPTCRQTHPHQRWVQWGWCHPQTGGWWTDDWRCSCFCTARRAEGKERSLEGTCFPSFICCLLSDRKSVREGCHYGAGGGALWGVKLWPPQVQAPKLHQTDLSSWH